MFSAYLALGSNLNQPKRQVINAIHRLASTEGIEVNRYSSLYRSRPLNGMSQNDYVNAVIEISTWLKPLSLLSSTQSIEHDMGRVRIPSQRWAPREIDIDILLYEQEIITSEHLTIPHYGLKQRSFVVYPLLEIAPDCILPCGRSLKDCKNSLNSDDLIEIGQIEDFVL